MEEEIRTLSPELEEKLRAVRGFSQKAKFLYVPEVYRQNANVIPKKEWPIFELKGKDGIDLADSEDDLGHELKNGKVYTSTGEVRIKVLKSNILGWKNFLDTENKEIVFVKDSDGVTTTCIARLTSVLQVELNVAINAHSTLTQEELEGLEF